MANYYIGGVGTVTAFKKNSDGSIQHYFDAKTLTDSSINISVSSEEIRGGEGSKLLGRFFHTSVFNLSMTDALFDLKYLASQVGSDVLEGQGGIEIKHDAKVTVPSNGEITLAGEPAALFDSIYTTNNGKVAWVKFIDNGFELPVVPEGNKITIDTMYAGQKVCVSYPVKVADARQITVKAMYTPMEFSIILEAKLFLGDACKPSDGKAIGKIVIEIPRFQLDGSVDLAMAMTSPATFALNGSALASGCGCGEEEWYARISEIKTEDGANKFNGYTGIKVLDDGELNVGDTLVVYAVGAKLMPKRMYINEYTAVITGSISDDKPNGESAIDGLGHIVSAAATKTIIVTSTVTGFTATVTTEAVKA